MNQHRIATRGALTLAALFALAIVGPAIAGDTKSTSTTTTTTTTPASADPAATTAKSRDYAASFDKLMQKKAELGLTAEQETRIAEIRKELKAKNQPLVDQIEGVIGARPTPEQMKTMTDEQREDFVSARKADAKSHPELQPVYKQLKENRKAAWEQMKAVLNPDQKAKVEQWTKEKKDEMGAKKAAKSKEASAEKPKTNY